jgi:hypothetical protein
MIKRGWHKLDFLFPEMEVANHRLPPGWKIGLFAALSLVFSLAAHLIPADGFIGFDWVGFFGIQRIPPFYPPWTLYAVKWLTYPTLVGLTLGAFALAAYQRSAHPISLAASFLCLPLLWTIFLGQVDGLALMGLLGLPWLVPLALIKPQVAIFALGARRLYLLAFLLVFGISLLIWPNWLAVMLNVYSFFGEGRFVQNIGLGWWGLPLFMVTVWFSRGDMDMLMASGAFISPYLIFYNLLPLTPAVARLKPRAAILALVLSFLTLSSNWLGPKGWWLGWFFVAWIWLNLATKRYPEWRVSRWVRWVG